MFVGIDVGKVMTKVVNLCHSGSVLTFIFLWKIREREREREREKGV